MMMSIRPSLDELKNRQLIWQASQGKQFSGDTISSGYTLLDQKLGGGWPSSGVVELFPEQFGIGELRLILPTLAALKQCNKLQAWVNPPARIIPVCSDSSTLSQMIIASPHRAQDHDWLVEQLLNSACCSSLVYWTRQLLPSQAKRFQIAAKNSQTLAFIIRTSSCVQQSLALSLRMKLQAHDDGLIIDIFKRQHGWPVDAFTLSLSACWPQLFESEKTGTKAGQDDNIIPFPVISSQSTGER